MPPLRPGLRNGAERRGGILGYPLQALYEEVAFVAYHVHWPPQTILDMDHEERRRWVSEISAINQRRNDGATMEQSLP